jgi:hypothetical protein
LYVCMPANYLVTCTGQCSHLCHGWCLAYRLEEARKKAAAEAEERAARQAEYDAQAAAEAARIRQKREAARKVRCSRQTGAAYSVQLRSRCRWANLSMPGGYSLRVYTLLLPPVLLSVKLDHSSSSKLSMWCSRQLLV